MAIGYGELKNINRNTGRSAVAAAAYRAHERMLDERTGEIFDYTPRRKTSPAESFLLFPAGESGLDRPSLWNASEAAENRKNSTTAREWIGALPREIDHAGQRRIAEGFARFLTEAHGVACDGSIHRNDPDNPHLHLLFTTRRFLGGKLGDKTRELDVKGTSSGCVEDMRQAWQSLCNAELRAAGFPGVDMRSYARQGIERTGQRKRTRQQSEAVKSEKAARRGERFARELEREADDLERKARRRRDASKPKASKSNSSAPCHWVQKVGNPWGAGMATKAPPPAFVSTGKARKMPEAIRARFPYSPPAQIFARLYPDISAAYPSAISGGGVGPASAAAHDRPSMPQTAGGMLPPPSGLSPDAYAAWLYAYRRALTVQHSAELEKRERARLRL